MSNKNLPYGYTKQVPEQTISDEREFQPIANCAFCGLPAIYKAADNTPLCKDCTRIYKAEQRDAPPTR